MKARRMNLRKLLSAALVASIIGGAAVASVAAPASAAEAEPGGGAGAYCSGESRVTKKLAAGTTWDLCWRIDATSGLTIEKVFFQGINDPAPIQAFDSVAPVLMNVPYDSGTAEFEDMSAVGWSSLTTDTMTVEECPDPDAEILTVDAVGTDGAGELVSVDDKPIMCLNEVETGLAGRSSFTTYTTDADGNRQGGYGDTAHRVTLQGTALVLFSHVTIGNYEYESRYTLHDNGSIDVGLGATGEISVHQWVDQMEGLDPRAYGWPVGTGESDYTPSHYHSGVWRVDFGIGGKDDQVVEEFNSAPTGERGAISPLIETTYSRVETESFRNIAPRRGWWTYSPSSLNADGHPRGYEIIFGKTEAYPSNPALRNDVAFTQKKDCELRPQDNAAPGCEGTTLIDFVDDEKITDPIAFVNVGFHHIARDEDQSPMPTHWQGFTLYPRDFTAQSPWTPESRQYRNGFVSTDELVVPGWQTNAPSTTALDLASDTVAAGEPARATVKIEAGDLGINGTVRLRDGGTEIASYDLRRDDHGSFTIEIPGLSKGEHSLTAYYEGNNVAASSESAPRTLTVKASGGPDPSASPTATATTTPTPSTTPSPSPTAGAGGGSGGGSGSSANTGGATGAPAHTGSSALPATGADTAWVLPTAALAVGAIVLGVVLVRNRRRRAGSQA
ncbi:Primary amine oxidase [Microbacterium sp. Bi128]|nr:Primary amine oxidase [Microbacterium sp. Bi128]